MDFSSPFHPVIALKRARVEKLETSSKTVDVCFSFLRQNSASLSR